MDTKKVTVIIPVYNTEKYLNECVSSVVNQTYKNLQIILVNDGSKDNSGEMCDNWQKKDSRIEVIHKQNEGLGLTRNRGLERSEGEFVIFLDSDDWISENHIENLVKNVNSSPESDVDVIFGSYTKVRNNGEVIDFLSLPYYGNFEEAGIRDKIMLNIIAADDDSKRDLGMPMSACFNLYSMNVIRKNSLKFKSEKITACEDLFFNLEYLNYCNKAMITKEVGYFYRYNPVSISKGYDEKQFERTEKLFNDLKELINELEINNQANNRIKRCLVAKIRGLLLMIARSDFSMSDKLKKIKWLLEEKWCREIFKGYDISSYRMSLKITTFCMKYKLYIPLYAMLTIKENLTSK